MTQNMLTTRMPIEAKCTLREERKGLFCMERSEKRKPVNVNRMSMKQNEYLCGFLVRSCGLSLKDCDETLMNASEKKEQFWWSSLRSCFLTSWSVDNC